MSSIGNKEYDIANLLADSSISHSKYGYNKD